MKLPEFVADILFRWACRYADRRLPDFIIGANSPDGAYLERWFLTPWRRWRNRLSYLLPNVYLHHFLRDDDDRALHDHPWIWCSLLISGDYIEHTIDRGGIHRRMHRSVGSIKFSMPSRPHRVELLKVSDFVATQPNNKTPISCWTIFITGPRVRTWGFHCPEQGWIPWQKFTQADNPGEVGKGCDA